MSIITWKVILLVVALVFMMGAQGHEDDEDAKTTVLSAGGAEATHRFARSCGRKRATCVLQAEVTEGPYYFDTQLVRQNITEGFAGVPMRLNISVIDVTSCSPIADAAVDIWHCNAMGVYSHFQNSNNNGGANTTFLRGIQMTDSSGLVSFDSIFPGWYQPRVIHIHVKVHIGGSSATSSYNGGSVVHTGQMFVSDSLASSFKTIAPYSSNSQTLNTLANDNIYTAAGSIAQLDVEYTNLADGVVASITLGVQTTATTTGSTSTGAATSRTSSTSTSPSSSSSSSFASSSSSTTAAKSGASSLLCFFSFSLAAIGLIALF